MDKHKNNDILKRDFLKIHTKSLITRWLKVLE